MVTTTRHYDDADQHYDMVSTLAPGLAAALAAATPEQRVAVRTGVDALTAPYRTGSGALELPASALVLHAHV